MAEFYGFVDLVKGAKKLPDLVVMCDPSIVRVFDGDYVVLSMNKIPGVSLEDNQEMIKQMAKIYAKYFNAAMERYGDWRLRYYWGHEGAAEILNHLNEYKSARKEELQGEVEVAFWDFGCQ